MSPLKRSPSFSRTATGASKSPVFTMKTSHAAKRQGDFFAEARASPTPHMHVEHLRSRRPGPACRHFVLQTSPQYARIVPSDDYDDLPDLIDTSPPPSPGSSASESPKRQRMAIDGRRFWSNSVNRDMLRVARGQSYAGNMICLAPGLHVSKFSRGQS